MAVAGAGDLTVLGPAIALGTFMLVALLASLELAASSLTAAVMGVQAALARSLAVVDMTTVVVTSMQGDGEVALTALVARGEGAARRSIG